MFYSHSSTLSLLQLGIFAIADFLCVRSCDEHGTVFGAVTGHVGDRGWGDYEYDVAQCSTGE